MKKFNWRKLFAPLAVLYVVIWVGFCGWAARQSRNNFWMVEQEINSPSTPAGVWLAQTVIGRFSPLPSLEFLAVRLAL